jgi:hypothetical protein
MPLPDIFVEPRPDDVRKSAIPQIDNTRDHLRSKYVVDIRGEESRIIKEAAPRTEEASKLSFFYRATGQKIASLCGSAADRA